MRSEGIIAEFLFDRWFLKAICDTGNHNGLVTNNFIQENLARNLQIVRDSLSSLVSSDAEFDISVYLLPTDIS